MPCGTQTHTRTRAHTQAAWLNCRGAVLCLHGTKVASSCQRLTYALAHTPKCTPTSFCWDGVTHAQHLYSHAPALTPAQWPAPQLRGQECAIALLPRACISYLWPPSPLAIIHDLFAWPGTQQCRKNSINASFICI